MKTKGIDIKIPVQADFTIIYKGKNKVNNQIVEKIDEIQANKEDLFRSLRYFKERSEELKQQDGIYIHDKFPNQVFKTFIKCVEKQEIHIDDNNYIDYYELSKKYKFYELEKEIKKFINNRPDLCQIIDDLSKSSNENTGQISVEKEELISKNLDFCIQSGVLKKLPINNLVRILNSPDRVLKNHQLLFNFLKQLFENSEKVDENYLPLLSSLDLCEMTVEEIGEFVNNELFVSSAFTPRRSNEGMRKLINDIQSKNELFKKFESEISKMKQKIEENEKIMKMQETVISQFKGEIETNKKQLNILSDAIFKNKKNTYIKPNKKRIITPQETKSTDNFNEDENLNLTKSYIENEEENNKEDEQSSKTETKNSKIKKNKTPRQNYKIAKIIKKSNTPNHSDNDDDDDNKEENDNNIKEDDDDNKEEDDGNKEYDDNNKDNDNKEDDDEVKGISSDDSNDGENSITSDQENEEESKNENEKKSKITKKNSKSNFSKSIIILKKPKQKRRYNSIRRTKSSTQRKTNYQFFESNEK